MKNINKIACLLLLLLFFSGTVQAEKRICEPYDDFSSGTLDKTKWIESTFHGDPFNNQHYINATDGIYHIIQTSAGDAETNLAPNITFESSAFNVDNYEPKFTGDSFSYNLIYYNGSGNHFSQPLINGNYPPSQIESCTASGGCGPVGYWNGVPDLGAQIGTYKINFEFNDSRQKMTTIRPDNVTIINTFTGNGNTVSLTINTHTGNNGLMHFGLSNFVYCRDVIDMNLTHPLNNKVFSENSLNLTFNYHSFLQLKYCKVFLDNNLTNSPVSWPEYNYTQVSNLSIGRHIWNIICLGGRGSFFNQEARMDHSENLTFWIIAKQNFDNETDTINLTSILDISNISGYYVKNNKGLINWTDSLNLSEGIDFAQYINISNNKVEINSTGAPALNKKARITLNNISWSTPRILKNGVLCGVSEGCTQISYNASSGEFIFDVTGFSTYETEETSVSSPAPSGGSSSSSSGGGGGGGGGGGSSVRVTNTNSSKNITNQSTVSNNTNENNTNVKVKGTSFITGATIGAIAKTYGIPIIIFIVAVLGAYAFVARRKNKLIKTKDDKK